MFLTLVVIASCLLQKKSQKRKVQDDHLDDDMDIEPQLRYKGEIGTKHTKTNHDSRI